MSDLRSRAVDLGEADRALKSKHRAMWASGDYAAVAHEIVGELGPMLVEYAGVKGGDRVLDVAAGAGSAAIAAARVGARVTASDVTPELFEAGRADAAAAGVDLDWREADAEALPFGGAEFEIVLSCIGVMFATMRPYAPPPAGAQPAPLWGDEDHVSELFAGRPAL